MPWPLVRIPNDLFVDIVHIGLLYCKWPSLAFRPQVSQPTPLLLITSFNICHRIFVIEYLHICIWIYICWWCCDVLNFKISICETDLWHASTGGGAGETRRRKVKSVSPAHFSLSPGMDLFPLLCQHSVNIWSSISVLNILHEMLWFSFLSLKCVLNGLKISQNIQWLYFSTLVV